MARKRKAAGKRKGRAARPSKRRARPTAEITISNRQRAVRVSPARLRRLIQFVARAEGQRVGAVDLVVAGLAETADLSRRYLRRRRPADVLSFDLSDTATVGIVAQLVVCGDLAATQGPLHGCRPGRELMLYVIHGLLHLMGYDDGSVRAAARMHARQEELLEDFLRREKRKKS